MPVREIASDRQRHGLALGAMVGMVLVAAGSAAPAQAQMDRTAIEQGRQHVLDAILTTDPPGTARWIRWDCAFRDDSAEVAKGRAEGGVTAPDASDTCVAALTRQAHDEALLALYQDILHRKRPDREEALPSGLQGLLTAAQSQNGDPEAATLPQRVVTALRDGSKRVDLGAGHVLTVTPGLAFDVGFSRAFWAGSAARPVAIDPDKLREVTEACVGQRADATVCFTAGYAQGGAVFRAGRQSTAR